MLPKRFLSLAAAWGLGLSGVFAIEQKKTTAAVQQIRQEAAIEWADQQRLAASLDTFQDAYQAQKVLESRFNASWREPEEGENFVALELFAKSDFGGSHYSVTWENLRENRCGKLFPSSTVA